MKNLKKLLLYFSFLMVSACSEKQRIFDAKNILYINIDESNSEYIESVSKLIMSVSYIPLQTMQKCLIGDMSKIIYTDDYIYILDRMSNKLYQFHKNGKFARQIGQMGRASSEYIKISNFDVNQQNGNISIYCEVKQSIIEYDFAGQILKVEKIGLVATDFIYYKDHYLFYCSIFPNAGVFKKTFPIQYRLAGVRNNIVDKQFLKYKYNEYLLSTIYAYNYNGLYKLNEHFMLIERPTGTIYKITQDTILSTYAVDFGKYNIPFDLFSSTASKAKIDRLSDIKICRLFGFYETNNLIYIQYVPNDNSIIRNSIYLKKDDKMINMESVWMNDIDNIVMPFIVAAKDNALIGYFNADSFYEMIKHSDNVPKHLIELNNIGNESDNPIICIIEFQK